LISTTILVVPSGLFAAKIMYQSSARSLSVMDNCTSLVSSYVIFFSSWIFSWMNKFFSRSFDTSPLNYGKLVVGSCPAILNDELLPPHSVDPCVIIFEMAPRVVSPYVDVLPAAFLPLKFSCLNGGVISGV
jgi:hypothetical protein